MIADFSTLKKYSLENPAWFNKEAVEFQKNRSPDSQKLLNLQAYLIKSKGNLDELKLKLGINITIHPDLPLVIFNYDHVKTPHDSLIGLECRGLVLEKDTWNLVAKAMYRFFNWDEVNIEGALHPNLDKKQFDFSSFVTESKEDGSLMVLFYYQGNWMLNTRTFFLNTKEKRKVVMSGIHEVYATQLIDVFVSALGDNIKSLNDLDPYLNRKCTYCFELCSEFNKIIRSYSKNTLFLLAIADNETLLELPPQEVDRTAAAIGVSRPKDYELQTFDEILHQIKEVIQKDPSLEGFVIRDKHSTRWKIKSLSYFFLHHIRYDKMRTPYPKDLVPLILQGESTELFSILELNGFTAELYEIQKQWKFCEERLKQGWELLKKDWERLIQIEDENSFFKEMHKASSPLSSFVQELYKENKKDLADLEEKWNQNPNKLVEALFTKEEQRPMNVRKAEIQVEHITGYKKAQERKPGSVPSKLSHSDWWKDLTEENDGLAKVKPTFEGGKWVVNCYCGGQMQLYSVPEYWYDYKCMRAPLCGYCKTSIVDKKKEAGALQGKGSNPVLTYQCECGLSHRAHQHQKKIDNELKRRPLKGKPLGIPCSDLCLSFRHLVHEEIEIILKEWNWERDQIYREISKILDVNMEDSHVGVLSISQCKTLIVGLREMRGVDV